jgi:drug/metabolite transporter (DMT)-like permease
VLYTVWSSTYLAIRVAVGPGSGFPPFSMSGLRVLAAGALLLAWTAMRRYRMRLTRDEARVLIVTGLLLWVGGNGLVTWSEQRVASGFAALVVGSMPLFAALFEALIDRRRPSRRLVAALVVGLAGVGVLTWPSLREGGRADLVATIALAGAPISWAAGTVYQRGRTVNIPPLVSSGYQHLVGAVGFLILVLVMGEPRPTPTPAALAAWAYLVVFGSIVGFTSFVFALRLLPMSIATTYAYVNPVFAAVLGWWLLDEPITSFTVVGAVLVLAGVAGVFREKAAAS